MEADRENKCGESPARGPKRGRSVWRRTVARFFRKPAANPLALNDQLLSLAALRRRRDQLFGRALFSDPAWDLLLELHMAHLAGRPIAFADLAARVGMAGATAGTWLGRLAERGLISYRNMPGSNQPCIALSPRAEALMQQLTDS